ncbi:NAD(P)/FAD-dependent oxidoreductase [Halorarum halophilum]|uniref:NAD(P)/FAD-dependent oxidoreductase n=1 Tax=Halorarum halophilum TaxID=2743090 RepID=A0A7D5GKR3_9EURY|nr:digeranylgeranylglycerophospholipid reductase [Halobaculum halophilum]QLG27584.1 NAD(P)/FAD-dependent oxidoreductase [Halobaculum halophilum]
MSQPYDAVIAGAGPAGAQCARDIAARGYDVVVLETETEEEFPSRSNKSTAGTFPSTMSSFGIPDDVVMNFTDSVVIESPNHHYERTQSGAVLEFADFKNWLVEEGRADGAEYWFDARVSKPLMEDGEIVGVVYNGDEEVRGEVVIDATGPSAPLAKKLGVADLERENQAIGIEYEYEGVDVDADGYADLTDAMMLRLDHRMAPGGYSWLFHTGEDTAKVGVCYLQNEGHRENARDGFTIDDYLTNWVDTDPRFENAERIAGKQHRGSAHIQLPTGLSTDNFMAIGDTVPSIDPLWGEGIAKCMRSGRAAAATVDACLTPDEPDTSAEATSVYDRLWHEDVAPKARYRLIMTELLYLGSNERYDRLVSDLNRLGEDTLKRANEGNLRALFGLLKARDVPLVAKYTRNQLSG